MCDFYKEKQVLAKEILNKIDLNYIAESIQDFSGWNMIGTTPKAICGLPVSVLKCLNSKDGVMVLKNEENRTRLYELYKKSPSSFKQQWNKVQCLFWQDFAESSPRREIDKNIIRILDKLKEFASESEYAQYKQYLQICDIYREQIKMPMIPKDDDYDEMLEKSDYLFTCALYEDKINWLLALHANKVKYFYEYEDEKYKISMLKSVDEFLCESDIQQNCLWSYIHEACSGEITILSLRKKESLEIPYVTIEVRGMPFGCPELWQVKGKYNEKVEQSVMNWILNYCDDRYILTFDCDDL